MSVIFFFFFLVFPRSVGARSSCSWSSLTSFEFCVFRRTKRKSPGSGERRREEGAREKKAKNAPVSYLIFLVLSRGSSEKLTLMSTTKTDTSFDVTLHGNLTDFYSSLLLSFCNHQSNSVNTSILSAFQQRERGNQTSNVAFFCCFRTGSKWWRRIWWFRNRRVNYQRVWNSRQSGGKKKWPVDVALIELFFRWII